MPAKARNYKKEYRDFHGTEAEKKRRAKRNAARRIMLKKGKVRKGQDVDHKDRNPHNNRLSNLRAMSPSKNRSRK